MSQIKNNVQLIGYVGKDPEMISLIRIRNW